MNDFIADDWKELLKHNNLDNFESIWNLDVDWFEEPNKRRGGWSGVNRIELLDKNGKIAPIFIKRQENHSCRMLKNPFVKIPTLGRELHNIDRFQKAGIPTATPIFYSQRQKDNNLQAILIAEELTHYQSLANLCETWPQLHYPPHVRNTVIDKVAKLIRRLHDANLQHSALFAKHIFVKIDSKTYAVDTKLIDLEGSGKRPNHVVRDLEQLNRNQYYWRIQDSIRFIKAYFGIEKLTPAAKKLWRKVEKRNSRKQKEHELRTKA